MLSVRLYKYYIFFYDSLIASLKYLSLVSGKFSIFNLKLLDFHLKKAKNQISVMCIKLQYNYIYIFRMKKDTFHYFMISRK